MNTALLSAATTTLAEVGTIVIAANTGLGRGCFESALIHRQAGGHITVYFEDTSGYTRFYSALFPEIKMMH